MQTVKELLLKTEAFFKDLSLPRPRREAELLMGHVLGLERVQVYMEFDRPLEDAEVAGIRALVRRRANREPLVWLLGEVGFYCFDNLLVHKDVLVPRPDSERLVDAALEWIPADAAPFVADVGAGTGAIGLALAQERPALRLYAIDASDAALANTKANVARFGLGDRVAVLKGDLLDPVPAQRPIDIVVSNPPYIRSADIADLEPEVSKWEPRLALDGGPDGLDLYRRLVPAAAARARLAVLVEIGFDQGDPVRRLFEQAGLVQVEVLPDLAGRDRVVRGRVAGG